MWQSVSVGVLFYVMSLSIGKARLPLLDRLPGDPPADRPDPPGSAPPFAQVIETLLKFHGCDLQNKWLQRTFDAVQDSKELAFLQPKVGYNLTTGGCSGRFSTKNGRKMIFRPFLLCGDQRLCMDR